MRPNASSFRAVFISALLILAAVIIGLLKGDGVLSSVPASQSLILSLLLTVLAIVVYTVIQKGKYKIRRNISNIKRRFQYRRPRM